MSQVNGRSKTTMPVLLESLEPRLLLTTWGPLIDFPTWEQGGVYDDLCPQDPRTADIFRSKVGCVATAAAQVLNYWEFPSSIDFSYGNDHYVTDTRGIRIDDDAVARDFPTLASLDSMLSVIDYDESDHEKAELSFGVGVKYEMDYTFWSGSGAYTGAGGRIFEDDFGFGSAEVGAWPRDRNEILDNIKAGWPVIAAIYETDPSTGDRENGHSVIIDGYDDNDNRFHVNLGWGGSGDDWYDLPRIDAGGYHWDAVGPVVYNIAPYYGWAQVGADAQNTYASPYTIPSTEPDLKWECTVPAGMSRYRFGEMVVGSEGKIYASLSPMDLGFGKHPYIAVLDPHGVIDKTIVISDSDYDINHVSQNSQGEVFFGTSEYATKSSVFRVNPKTDTVTRIFDHTSPDRGIFDQPIKIDGDDHLYFLVTPTSTSNGAKFYSLTRSGSERWTASFSSQMKFHRSTAAIDEARDQVYLNYYDSSTQKSYLRCFDRSNGSVKWTHAFPGTHTASEMASPASVGPDGTVYVGCFTSVYALSPTNGGEIWSTDFYPSYVMGEGLRAVGTDGTVYVGHGKMVSGNWRPAYVSALDPSDGSIKWQREVASGLSSFDNMGEIYVGRNGVVAATYTKNDANRLAGIIDNGSSSQVAWDVEYGGKMAFGPGQTIYVVPAEIEASIYALSVGDRGDPDGLGMAYTNNQQPALPSNLGPAEGSQELDTTVTLSWACSDPDVGQNLFYEVYLGGGAGDQQGEMIPVETSFAGTSLVLNNLAPGESYVWRVIATDGQTITPGPGWTFSTAPLVELVGRHVFYNNSYFDGNNAGANSSDDSGIDTSKQALLPGEIATFANYTTYSRGLNGIMIDIDGSAGTPSVSDFVLKVGNDDNPDGWATAPAPTSITVRTGEGEGGSDRVTLLWADNAIQKQWLQVTVLSDANGGSLGLAENDVFYFGNSIGETGNSPSNTFVDGTDFVGVRDNPHNFLDRAPVTDAYDINRDSFVDGTDLVLVRDNNTNFLNCLKLIGVPAATGGAESMLVLSLASEPMVMTASSPEPTPALAEEGKTEDLLAQAAIFALPCKADVPAAGQVSILDAWVADPGAIWTSPERPGKAGLVVHGLATRSWGELRPRGREPQAAAFSTYPDGTEQRPSGTWWQARRKAADLEQEEGDVDALLADLLALPLRRA